MDDTLAVARESFAFWSPLVARSVHVYALLGNEDGETSFRPHAVGDHGEAFGPFQWHAARVEAMALPPPRGCGIDVRMAPHLDQLRPATDIPHTISASRRSRIGGIRLRDAGCGLLRFVGARS